MPLDDAMGGSFHRMVGARSGMVSSKMDGKGIRPALNLMVPLDWRVQRVSLTEALAASVDGGLATIPLVTSTRNAEGSDVRMTNSEPAGTLTRLLSFDGVDLKSNKTGGAWV